jgi:hypothetical protein
MASSKGSSADRDESMEVDFELVRSRKRKMQELRSKEAKKQLTQVSNSNELESSQDISPNDSEKAEGEETLFVFKGVDDIKARTLNLRLPRRAGRAYTREEVLCALLSLEVLSEDIEALGSLQFPNNWNITFKSKSVMELVLEARVLTVAGKEGRVNALHQVRVMAKCHWLPWHVRDEDIDAALGPNITLLRVKRVHVDGVWSLIRDLDIVTKDMSDIPHFLEVECEEDSIRAFLTVKGRPPVCLRCKTVGHVSRDCSKKYCRMCRDWGDHLTDECFMRRSYASAVKENVKYSEEEFSDYIEGDDIKFKSQVLLGKDEEGEGRQPSEVNVLSRESTESSGIPCGQGSAKVLQEETQKDSAVSSGVTCGQGADGGQGKKIKFSSRTLSNRPGEGSSSEDYLDEETLEEPSRIKKKVKKTKDPTKTIGVKKGSVHSGLPPAAPVRPPTSIHDSLLQKNSTRWK